MLIVHQVKNGVKTIVTKKKFAQTASKDSDVENGIETINTKKEEAETASEDSDAEVIRQAKNDIKTFDVKRTSASQLTSHRLALAVGCFKSTAVART